MGAWRVLQGVRGSELRGIVGIYIEGSGFRV